jgi:hypothetical protein
MVANYANRETFYPGITAIDIGQVGFNPLVSESIAIMLGDGAAHHIWIGSGGSLSQGAALSPVNNNNAMTYGFGKWRGTGIRSGGGHLPTAWIFSSSGGTLEQTIALPVDIGDPNQCVPAGSTPIAFLGGPANKIYRYINNFQDTPTLEPDDVSTGNGMDSDPTGNLLMGQWDTGNKGKSADGGASWSALSTLPVGTWMFRYAGTAGTTSTTQWIAAGGSSVRLSMDFGSTWLNREGDILSSFPLGAINYILVVG